MNLITRVEIEGFRSVATATIDIKGEFVCLVGSNNCGKSNILRALSLFFTGEPEPDVSLNLYRDCYADPRSKKKKQITISVSFRLPSNFRFRQSLEDVKRELGEEFTIRRRWSYYPPEPITEVSRHGEGFQPLHSLIFSQLKDLIKFRYIQNRVVPTQVLREESAALQAGVGRLLRLPSTAQDLLNGVHKAASTYVSEADQVMRKSTKSIAKLEIFTPSEIAALAAFSGIRAQTSTGAMVSDYTLGAGSQALMMFALLKIIDTDYGRHFGWRQATVWAIEEPESSLHKDLEQRLAILLRDWSEENGLRMQLFATTHSEVFVSAASQGLMVDIDRGKTSVRNMPIPELVHNAATMGISGPVEPILCFPMNPVVLVEGDLDVRILEHVANKTGVASNCKFVSLPKLDKLETGAGADQMIKYLKRYGRLIQNRAKSAPLVVLFDWEIEDQKLQRARNCYGENANRRVLRMDIAHADPSISPQIRGIERFYPRDLFIAARKQDKVDIAIDQGGNISVEKEKMKSAKSMFADMLCGTSNEGWYQHLSAVLTDVKNASAILPDDQIALC